MRKKSIYSSVCSFNQSRARTCSSLVDSTIQMIISASYPEAYVIILPKWSWFVASSWFSMIIFRPVFSSSARISAINLPTRASVWNNLISIPISSLNSLKFSSRANQFVKSIASCSHTLRKSPFSYFPNFTEFINCILLIM
jgi:hypothetical protein